VVSLLFFKSLVKRFCYFSVRVYHRFMYLNLVYIFVAVLRC